MVMRWVIGGVVGAILLAGLVLLYWTPALPMRGPVRLSGAKQPAPESPTTPAITVSGTKADAGTPALLSTKLPSNLQRSGAMTLGDALGVVAKLAPGTDRSLYYQQLIAFAVAQDARATLGALTALSDPRLVDFGVEFALLHWGAVDPEGALQWAAQHPRGANDHRWFQTAYEGYAAQTPMEAMQMLTRSELQGDLDALTKTVMYHLEQHDQLADARVWIERLPEGSLRQLLVEQLITVWAARQPEDAANWLASTASDASFRAGMGAFVRAVATNDPQFAAGLTQKFKDPQIQQQYLAEVIYLWAKQDLGTAAAWLRQQPPTSALDAARVRMAEATAAFDPAEAKAWADAITDPERRAAVWRQLSKK